MFPAFRRWWPRATPILASLLLTVLPVAGAAPSFRPIFNGRDLRGWVNVNCAPETFTVRDGMIHCDGIPSGALRTERQYENFVLELEWRHLKPSGNAGVFIWSGPMPALGQPFLRAIEVQVLDHGYGKSDWFTTHGDIFPIHGSTMKPFSPSRGDRSFPKESRSLGAPEWNHYRIVATNGVLRLSVNGVEVSGGTDATMVMESANELAGYPLASTTNIPATLGSPAESDALIFGDWGDLLIGLWSKVAAGPQLGSHQIEFSLRHGRSDPAVLPLCRAQAASWRWRESAASTACC